MFCLKCAKEYGNDVSFCKECGEKLKKIPGASYSNNNERFQTATAAMILGIIGIFYWTTPLFGLGVNAAGIACGIIALKSNYAKRAMTGLILSTIGIIFTFLFMFLGTYIVYFLEARHFQVG